MTDSPPLSPSARGALVTGFLLLAVFVPLGLVLEVLHAYKQPTFLGSATRQDMWRLCHAHGNMLGVLLLAFASIADRALPDETTRAAIGRLLRIGAVLMPTGFLAAGILNSEGDPSLGIVLVPLGGLLIAVALVRAALAARTT